MNKTVLDNINAIDTTAARLWSRQDGVVVIQIKPKIHLGKEESSEILSARMELYKSQPQRVLVDAREVRSSDPKAWDFTQDNSKLQITKVLAYLAHRPVEKGLVSFYFSPSPGALFQSRLFMDENKALEWLDLFRRIDL
ncbi:hypothetical protein HZR84_07275 [Hyphobacterium sp. CCMP332]|nr:hypothetical protein HZR84_07275 [Hyphobacterium sp. CCMP332]